MLFSLRKWSANRFFLCIAIQHCLESGKETDITLCTFIIRRFYFIVIECLIVLIPHIEQDGLHRCVDPSLLLKFQLSDSQQLTTGLFDVPDERGIGNHFTLKDESDTRYISGKNHAVMLRINRHRYVKGTAF